MAHHDRRHRRRRVHSSPRDEFLDRTQPKGYVLDDGFEPRRVELATLAGERRTFDRDNRIGLATTSANARGRRIIHGATRIMPRREHPVAR